MSRFYDVHVHSSNTIYKKVPFDVVAQWADQGRLGKADKLRRSGTEAWHLVEDDTLIRDFLFSKTTAAATVPQAPPSMDVEWRNVRDEDDDDVDMIPLIDISLVLLIFFMMTAAVSALSPVDVPTMKKAYDLKPLQGAITLTIEKRASGDPSYGLRIGEKGAEPGDGDLDTLPVLLARLDERLTQYRAPPEVRFAAHKELTSEKVHELVKELQKRKVAGKIAVYRAEVNEKK